jgi:hypothetical protein
MIYLSTRMKTLFSCWLVVAAGMATGRPFGVKLLLYVINQAGMLSCRR